MVRLKDFVKLVGNARKVSRQLNVSPQLLNDAIKKDKDIFIEHDNNLNPTNAFVKKGWGKFKTT